MSINIKSFWLVCFALLMSVFVGWLSIGSPLPILVLAAVTIGSFFIAHLSSLWLIVFTVCIHFDDLFVPLGFAKIGYGDFALALLLVYWPTWRFNRSTPLQFPKAWPFLILYLIGVGLSWLQGPAPEQVMGLYIRQCLYIAGFFMLIDLIRTERLLHLFLWTILFSCVVHVLVGFYLDGGSRRFVGLVGQPNSFAGLIGPGALIALSMNSVPHFKRWLKVFFSILGGLVFFGLILTVSRGAQVAFTIALLWSFRHRKREIIIGALLLGFVFGLILFLQPERLDYFFLRWQLEDASVHDRQAILRNALRIIYEHPFFGFGFAQFRLIENYMQIDHGHDRASHNYYMGELSTLGIPTVMMLYIFILQQAKSLFSLDRVIQLRDRAYIITLQSLLIFQSITLIFRGGRRMIEWSFLAIYSAAVIIYYKKYEVDP